MKYSVIHSQIGISVLFTDS